MFLGGKRLNKIAAEIFIDGFRYAHQFVTNKFADTVRGHIIDSRVKTIGFRKMCECFVGRGTCVLICMYWDSRTVYVKPGKRAAIYTRGSGTNKRVHETVGCH
jgi:hypothetical protein